MIYLCRTKSEDCMKGERLSLINLAFGMEVVAKIFVCSVALINLAVPV